MNPLEFPHLDSYINDFSSVLSEEKRQALDTLFQEHESKTTEQVVTILFPHRQGNELLEIGLKVFNENGIGQKNLNNGLLLIVATEEKKIRIVVGKGLELKYTEMRCREIIENHLRPLLNEGKYEQLIQKWNTIVSSSPKEQKEKIIHHFITLKRLFISSIIILGILAYINWDPGNCRYIDPVVQDKKICEITVFGKKIEYTIHPGNSDYSSDSSSDSDWGGGSSFDGGGGSSNGGGWGD